ncbi:NAD(P)H-hydrate epimerase [Candidatus Woesearchaeota archaeon]|jgi:hydroxyethylthiazole kinase-like uncharacterized protein yjeF|nr:NAD(P)H-hydrate epimerase [Candidatus Woesearchaeota archaeon]
MITAKDMRELEDLAVEQGISKFKLMENAGKQLYFKIKEKYDLNNKKIVIFAGSGNNGGDGFAAARLLAIHCPILIFFFGDKEKLSVEAEEHYKKIKAPINIIQIKNKFNLNQFHFQPDQELLLIDALLGTGIKGPLREPLPLAIDYFNSLEGIKVAVDLPSGLDPDTGEAQDKYCQVDLIITFHDLKVGLEKYKEKTIIVDIGIPKQKITE